METNDPDGGLFGVTGRTEGIESTLTTEPIVETICIVAKIIHSVRIDVDSNYYLFVVWTKMVLKKS